MPTAVKTKRKPASSAATTRNSMVAEHMAASKRVMRKVLASKEQSIAFLIGAGILAKGGKRLAKAYR